MDAETVRNHSGGLRLGFLVHENDITVTDLHKFNREELSLFYRLTTRDDLKQSINRLIMVDNSF